MKKLLKFLIIGFALSILIFSCEKKPLTLDDETSMKTLLKASDNEIKELVIKEASEKANICADNIDVEYILRDEKSQTIVVKSKVKKD
ncbi:MAG: hypothetical protein ACTTHG_00030 [Treponemataceae bacterium]